MIHAIGILLVALLLTGCVGGTLGRWRTYVTSNGTDAGRKADYEACSPPGIIAMQWLPGLVGAMTSTVAESRLPDCMAARGWQKSQRGMVEPDDLAALQPLPVER